MKSSVDARNLSWGSRVRGALGAAAVVGHVRGHVHYWYHPEEPAEHPPGG